LMLAKLVTLEVGNLFAVANASRSLLERVANSDSRLIGDIASFR
jgi:hypothetical protein